MTNESLLPLIGYIRVSGRGQVDAYGPDIQRADIESWAAANNARIVGWCSDEAVSGMVEALDREGLACAIDAVREGEADGVVAANLSRLARTLTVQEGAMALIWGAGGRVFVADSGEVAADDPDDPMRTAIRQIVGVMNQLDRATIALRLRKARQAKAAAGGYGHGGVPYGFVNVDRTLVVDPCEADAVERMRTLRAQGMTLRAIAADLTAAGVKPRRGSVWHPNTVARILSRVDTGAGVGPVGEAA